MQNIRSRMPNEKQVIAWTRSACIFLLATAVLLQKLAIFLVELVESLDFLLVDIFSCFSLMQIAQLIKPVFLSNFHPSCAFIFLVSLQFKSNIIFFVINSFVFFRQANYKTIMLRICTQHRDILFICFLKYIIQCDYRIMSYCAMCHAKRKLMRMMIRF